VTRGASIRSESEKDSANESFQTFWLDAESGRIRLEEYASSDRKRRLSVRIVRIPQTKATAPAGAGGNAKDSRRSSDETITWEIGLSRDGKRYTKDGKGYKEHRGDLEDFQKRRTLWERQMLKKILNDKPAEREAALKHLHLKRDGSREVFIDYSPTGPRLGYPCRRIQVTENGRQILDADIAESIDAGGEENSGGKYFSLYRRLGVFSDEVLEKLVDVRGIPLRAKITIVTELSPRTIEVEVTKVTELDFDEKLFSLPEGAKLIPKTPPISKCPVCGKRFETKKGSKVLGPNGTVWSCSQKCHKAIDRAIKLGQPLPRADAVKK